MPSASGQLAGLQARSGSGSRCGSSRGGLPGPVKNSALSAVERSLIGAARWPDDAPGVNISNKSHTPENKRYCESFYKASRSAACDIASGRISTFDGLWQKATQWRLSRISSSDPAKTDFMSVRQPGRLFVTSLRPPYHSVIERVQRHPDAATEIFSGEHLGGVETKVYRQYGTVSGTEIPMTVVSAAADLSDLHNRLWSLPSCRNRRDPIAASMARSHPNMITHTDGAYLQVIKEHLEALYTQAINPPLNQHEALELISRVHWWAACAAPDQRGSAAKAEFAARSIASAHGIELPPFKHGVVPDIEAMLCSEEEFVSQYPNLFERSPL
ncbi:hypothetical protein NBM50_00260 [Xylophilus ampelinus]|nr:hypothetical protein [Xylophilus ampelinus]